MDKRQINQLNMYDAVEQVLNAPANTAIWSGNPAMSTAVGTFTGHLSAINANDTVQKTSSTGTTQTKDAAQLAMAKAAVKACNAGRAYATIAGNTVLFDQMSHTITEITGAADTDADDICQNIHDNLNPYIALMGTGGYGATATTQTALQNLINTYSGMIGKTALQKAIVADATLTLEQHFTAENAILKNSFVPANNYEAKMQQVNSVKIKLADTTGTMPVTTTDISTLKNIANGCPDSYGKAFYEARSILNLLYGQEKQYSSHCADGSSYRLGETEGINQIANNAEQVKVSLYPNPNTGMFEVNYDLSASNTDGVLSILDLNGKVLATYTLKQNEISSKIDASTFANGMYMYSIQAANIMPITGKLVIIK